MLGKLVKTFVFGVLVAGIASAALAAPTFAARANPAGNNGTIKINGDDLTDSVPNNDPHVSCDFKIDFYNYDQDPNYYADVEFELKSPTDSASHSLTVTSGDLTPFIGGNPADGSLDASETYTLAFTGTPQTNQGYHVKVTIEADGSQGNDTKHKTFWVAPCTNPEKPVVDVLAGPCVNQGDTDGTLDVTVTNPNWYDVTYEVKAGAVVQTVFVAAGDSEIVSFTGLSAGDYSVLVRGDNQTRLKVDVTIGECFVPPLLLDPTLTVTPSSCVQTGLFTGSLTVVVTNPNVYNVTYFVSVGALLETVLVGANSSETVIFTGLSANTYNVDVSGDNDTSTSGSATIAACPPGQVLGDTTTTPPATLPQVLSTSTVKMPEELPATGASPFALLFSLVPAVATYFAALKRQKYLAAKAGTL